MSKQSTVVIDRSLKAYDFGPAHPLGPIRILLTYDALENRGLLSADSVRVVAAEAEISDAHLAAVHGLRGHLDGRGSRAFWGKRARGEPCRWAAPRDGRPRFGVLHL